MQVRMWGEIPDVIWGSLPNVAYGNKRYTA